MGGGTEFLHLGLQMVSEAEGKKLGDLGHNAYGRGWNTLSSTPLLGPTLDIHVSKSEVLFGSAMCLVLLYPLPFFFSWRYFFFLGGLIESCDPFLSSFRRVLLLYI